MKTHYLISNCEAELKGSPFEEAILGGTEHTL